MDQHPMMEELNTPGRGKSRNTPGLFMLLKLGYALARLATWLVQLVKYNAEPVTATICHEFCILQGQCIVFTFYVVTKLKSWLILSLCTQHGGEEFIFLVNDVQNNITDTEVDRCKLTLDTRKQGFHFQQEGNWFSQAGKRI